MAATNTKLRQAGQLSIQILLFSSIAIVILAGLVLWADYNIKTAYRNTDQQLAFHIAEAGIDYYRWHLAHAHQDYQDGTGQPGPYVHDYFDKSGGKVGKFILDITPPPIGSTVVTVRSTGKIDTSPSIERIIEVKFAISSFAKYAVVANAIMRFGSGTEVFGPIHSNDGIRFDGLAHNIVTSTKVTYDDPDHPGANEFAVHTHVAPTDPLPSPSPKPLPNRPDVFIAGRGINVPPVNFAGIGQSLSNIKQDAIAAGVYASPSGAGYYGYDVVLRDNGTFDLYKISRLWSSPSSNCTRSDPGWGTWSIQTEEFFRNYSYPTNGLLFVEDNVWVRGKINNNRLTIASGRFPEQQSTRSSITVNSNVLYTNYDGQDVLSLVAQNNISIGLYSADNLRIDAALMANNGRVGRYYYNSYCGSTHKRNSITSYGMIASNQRYGFAYVDGTGYQDRILTYDPNLLYGPPPSFPLTSDQYSQIYWKELK